MNEIGVTSAPPPSLAIPDLSVVIVCWNNKRYLEPCLQSLFAAGLKHSFDVAIIDNGSTDGTQVMVRESFPQARLIQNDRNVGLSRASNQGIESTRGSFVLLLNDDTLVNRVSLDAMIEFMYAHPDAGAVGGKLLNPDGSFQAGYGSFSSLAQEFLIATRLSSFVDSTYPLHGADGEVRVVDWLSSACLLLRRSALAKVGLLLADYFIYGDEVDLQYRLKREGWKVYYLPFVATVHFGGRSLDRWRRRQMVYRGKMLFYKNNYNTLATISLRVMIAALTLAKLVLLALLLLMPGWGQRAKVELNSNLDVLHLCWNLE